MTTFDRVCRNKRSISLDLKKKEGLSIFFKLVKKSDVIIEGFRPGVTDRLGIDFNTLKKIKSNIIYCSLIGYKKREDRPGHDLNYTGSAGILHLTGPKNMPVNPGVPIGDIGGGSLPAVISILAALYQRKNNPQLLIVSMTEQLIPWITIAATAYFAKLGDPEREEHPLSGYLPFYRLFKTKDKENRFITFAPIERKFWINFCISISREDLVPKQFDFDLLNSELPKIFSRKSQTEWKNWFVEHDIPGGPVLTIDEVFNDESRLWHINHPTIGNIPVIASPFLEGKSDIKPPPMLGEHTKEILARLGMEQEYIRLKAEEVIYGPE
ncbi:MAG: CaiB/BaiF CoA transferase family protein [Candidatus Hodarchaeales archaeon]|jgi:crotonobetainyl-CoA:carnitine CoA-transferase CaiB-like acyl-CoA transferase